MLGGTINYSQNTTGYSGTGTTGTNNAKATLFGGGINYGYLLSDHFMMGINLGYNTSVYTYHSVSGSGRVDINATNQSYSTGLFARYYQKIGQSRFYFFGQLLVSHSNGTGVSKEIFGLNNGGTGTEDRADNKSSIYDVNLVPGIVYMINDKFGIETTIGNFGYNSNTTRLYRDRKEYQKNTDNTFQANLALSTITFGLHFYFGKTGQ